MRIIRTFNGPNSNVPLLRNGIDFGHRFGLVSDQVCYILVQEGWALLRKHKMRHSRTFYYSYTAIHLNIFNKFGNQDIFRNIQVKDTGSRSKASQNRISIRCHGEWKEICGVCSVFWVSIWWAERGAMAREGRARARVKLAENTSTIRGEMWIDEIARSQPRANQSAPNPPNQHPGHQKRRIARKMCENGKRERERDSACMERNFYCWRMEF